MTELDAVGPYCERIFVKSTKTSLKFWVSKEDLNILGSFRGLSGYFLMYFIMKIEISNDLLIMFFELLKKFALKLLNFG